MPDPASAPEGEARCAGGHEPMPFAHGDAVRAGTGVDRCSRCGNAALYSQKDFDQRLGCLLLGIGAAAALGASWRFGGVWFVPVLLAFVAVDWWLARRVGEVVICYRCDAEYRDVPEPSRHRPYDPHVAERDAERKTVRRMRP